MDRMVSQSVNRANGIVTTMKNRAATHSEVTLKRARLVDRRRAQGLDQAESDTSAVSFCSETKSFISGGVTLRIACGRITRVRVWP